MSEILGFIDINDYGLQSMVAGGGKMQDKTATPTTSQQVIEPDQGYDGMSSVTVNAVTSAIDENIIPTNIRSGKTILGVQGNLEPDKPDQNKTVTPSTVQQVVVADTGYELAQVTVEAVPDETPELNAQDTLLGNQETLIGQLESALDDKIALDLQAATSDANATASDILRGKSAYINGNKVNGNIQVITGNLNIGNEGASARSNLVTVFSSTASTVGGGLPYLSATARVFMNVSNNTLATAINLQAGQIKKDEVVLGVTGTYEGTSTPDWTQIGYSETPQEVTNGFNHAQSIMQNWTVKSDYSYEFEDDIDLIFMPLVNTSSATAMQGMFQACSSLMTIPLLNTSNVTNMSSMFASCGALSTIPLLNTSNVTNMSSMFANCLSLTSIPQLDTSNVTNMSSMFSGCKQLTTMPVLNTSKVTSIVNMFTKCGNLSNESLNNILAMCIGATSYTGTKTLATLGLTSTQATTCQSLSNWDAFVAAGWSSGY